jgi:Flp pilus assembly protein TadG
MPQNNNNTQRADYDLGARMTLVSHARASQLPALPEGFRVKQKERRSGTWVERVCARLVGGDEGNAIIEFSLMVPLMMAFTMGIFTCGIALSNYVALTNAVDTGARLLAVSRGETTDPCASAVAAVYAAAPQLVQTSITFTFVLNGTSYSGTSCPAGAANLVTAEPAQVTATYPAQINLFGVTPSSLNLTAQTTELVQ